MELGVLIYFLVVFVAGGLLLLAVVVYFLRELVFRGDRRRWSQRSKVSRAGFVGAGCLLVILLSIPSRMIWVTRAAAVPGNYRADGVWGNADLKVLGDGTFIETWHLVNEYTGKGEGDGETRGRWSDQGRDGLTRNIFFKPFKQLRGLSRNAADGTGFANVMGYGGATSIEIPAGSDIVFRR